MAVIVPPAPGSPAARAFARQRNWGLVISLLPALWLVAALVLPGFHGRVAGHFTLHAALALLPGLLMLSRARSWWSPAVLVLLAYAVAPWWLNAVSAHAPLPPANLVSGTAPHAPATPPTEPGPQSATRPSAQDPAAQDPAAQVLTVVQANVYEYNRDRAAAVAAVAAADPDLVSLLEATPTTAEDLLNDKRWPYHLWWGDNCGIGLVSRQPLENPEQHLDDDGGWAWGLSATVHLAGRPLKVIVLHLASPITPERQHQHDAELFALARWLDQTTGPVLLMGDLNLATGDREWRWFTARAGLLGPAHEPATWPSWLGPAGIAIDHILVRGLALSPPQPLAIPGSDHRGLIATVALGGRPDGGMNAGSR